MVAPRMSWNRIKKAVKRKSLCSFRAGAGTGLRIADGFPKPATDGFPLCGDALSREVGGLRISALLVHHWLVNMAIAQVSTKNSCARVAWKIPIWSLNKIT